MLKNEFNKVEIVDEDLIGSKNHFQRMFDNAPIGIFHSSLEGKLYEANQYLSDILGYKSPEDLIFTVNKTDIKGHFFADEKKHLEFVKDVLKDNQWHFHESRFYRKDCSIMTAEISIKAIRNSDDSVKYLEGFIKDIPERKKYGEKIQHLANVVKSSDDAIITKSLEGIILSWNKGAEHIYGYSDKKILGKPISILEPYNRKGETKKLIKKIKVGKKIKHYETLRLRRDRTLINLSITLSPVFDTDGELVAISTIARDITERKLVEEQKQELLEELQQFTEGLEVSNEELQDTTKEFQAVNKKLLNTTEELQAVNKKLKLANNYNRSLIEASLDPLVTIGPDGKITDVNLATELVTGYYRDELIDTDFSDYFTEPEKAREGHQNAFQEGLVRDYPLKIQHNNGSITPVLYNASVYKDEFGKVIGVSAAARDITKLKRAEKELQESKTQLKIAMDLAKLVHWEYDVETDMFTFDDQFYLLYGTSVEKEGGAKMSPEEYATKFIPPEESSLVAEEIVKVLETDDPNYFSQVEHSIIRADGEKRFITVRVGVIKDYEGHTIKIYGANQDITERKKAEIEKEKLFEQVQQFAEELVVSNEELQATTEELHIANEELRQQGDDLIRINQALHESEQRVRKKLESILSPEEDIENLDLVDIIDTPAIQLLMDDFYKLTRIPIGILDLKGNVLVGVGWQDICTKFHRIHPETCKHCIESDIQLSKDVSPGKFKLYKCKNNMWDIATPIMIGNQHFGNIFLGQFFFDDEEIDYELFRMQARKYGFNEEEYIAALKAAPMLSRYTIDESMAFFMKLANIISKLSYSNIKLAKSLTNGEILTKSLQESETKFRELFNNALDIITLSELQENMLPGRFIEVNEATIEKSGYTKEEFLNMTPLDLFAPNNQDEIPRIMAELQKRRYTIFETVYMVKDGRQIPAEVNVHIFKLGGKKVALAVARDITERKKVEKELELANKYNRSLIEASLDPFVTIGHNGKITDVNRTTELVTGCSGDKLIGTDFSNYFTEPRKARNGYKQVFKEGLVRDYPLEIKHIDGRTTPVLYNATVYRNESNEIVGVFAAARDITERKRDKEALQESEKKYRDLTELLPQPVFESDLNGNITFANHMGLETFGFTQEELDNGLNMIQVLALEDHNKAMIDTQKMLNGEGLSVGEYTGLRKDGTTFPMIAYVSPIIQKDKIIGSRGVLIDISELKKAEKAIIVSEEKYRSIFETAPNLIISMDDNFNIVDCNNLIQNTLGYNEDEIIGKSMIEIIHSGCLIEAQEYFKKLSAKDCSYNNEYKLIKKDGTVIDVLINAAALKDDDKKYSRTICIIQDITEHNRAGEKIKASLKEKEILLKEIHHRVKNNLQVISSLLDLQSNYVDEEEALNVLQESQNRVKSMAMIHEMLYQSTDLASINFSNYIQNVVYDLFYVYTTKSNIRPIIDVKQVFLNIETAIPCGLIISELVSNSLKYAFPGNNVGEIFVSCHSYDREFELIISDNGIGFPENLDFENIETSLGLRLVSMLVNQLEGSIKLDRTNGTKFTIKFKELEYEKRL